MSSSTSARRPGSGTAVMTAAVALLTTLVTTAGLLVAAPGALTPAHAADAADSQPPVVRLTISDDAVRVGETFEVSWQVLRSERTVARGAWSGVLPASGSRTVRADAPGSHIYALSAANQAGAVLVEAEVEVLRRAKKLAVRAEPLVLRGGHTRVQARGLAPREEFSVSLGGHVIGRGRADEAGRVDRRVAVPRAGRGGPTPLHVTGSVADRRGQVQVRVLHPRRLPLRLALPAVEAGRDQTVTVRGLAPREQVTVRHRGLVVVRGRADRRGRFAALFDVGPGWGSTTVTATGAFPARRGEASFDVVPRTPDRRTEIR